MAGLSPDAGVGPTAPDPRTPPAAEPDPRPAADPTRLAILVAAGNVVLFALVSVAGWASWGGLAHAVGEHHGALRAGGEGTAVVLANVAYGAFVIAVSFALRPFAHAWRTRVLVVVAAAIVAAPLRALALVAIHTTPTGTLYSVVEWVLGAAAGAVAVVAGLVTAALVERARAETRRREDERRRAARAIDELQAEELRVRRLVSDQLHGRLQFRLVTVTAALDAMSRELAAAGDDRHARQAREHADTLDEIREEEVRSLSHTVFPSGVDLGAGQAIDVLLRRLPPSVEASMDLGETYRRLIDEDGAPLPIAERLVAVYTVEEAVTNALKHGRARRVQVRADATATSDPARWVFEVTVDDDGTGLADPLPPLHGLARHRERVEQRGGTLDLVPNPAGRGTRLRLTLPFERQRASRRTGRPR